jgi:hypothetical protein
MSGMMQRWHQALPSPYQPGTGMGPGMMSGHDWAGMHRSAELALCRDELRAGASPQARHLAQAMLTERQAQLAQLQRWHHSMDHTGEHAGPSGD